MASLTQTAYYSRKIIKYGSIFAVAFLILRSLFLSFTAYWKQAHPPAPPKPTYAFGKLPKLSFPERKNLPPIEFKLETIAGSLPNLSDQIKVYHIPAPSKGLTMWDDSKAWAKKMGFDLPPSEMGTYDYRFASSTLPKTLLDVNVWTKNFHLHYDWKTDLNITSQTTPPLDSQAISTVKGILQTANALSSDLTDSTAEVAYYKYSDAGLVKALYSAEANFVQVNLFRKEIEKIKIMPANPKTANVNALLSSSYQQMGGIIDLKYSHYTISENKYATYSLKSVNSAWSQLTSGKGFIANLGNNPEGKIIIRNVYLAYYESEEMQSYLQPIFVFEGDNDFFAYIPAIADNWVEQ